MIALRRVLRQWFTFASHSGGQCRRGGVRLQIPFVRPEKKCTGRSFKRRRDEIFISSVLECKWRGACGECASVCVNATKSLLCTTRRDWQMREANYLARATALLSFLLRDNGRAAAQTALNGGSICASSPCLLWLLFPAERMRRVCVSIRCWVSVCLRFISDLGCKLSLFVKSLSIF